jgi:hypothetical protein
MGTALGTFEVELAPQEPELNGAVNRFGLTKTFRGDLRGTGEGVMLASGDPQSGSAGYVAMETVVGHLDGRRGSFVMAQMGVMHGGGQTLHYVVVPGSGQLELQGVGGTFALTIEADGTHRYQLEYAFTDATD